MSVPFLDIECTSVCNGYFANKFAVFAIYV